MSIKTKTRPGILDRAALEFASLGPAGRMPVAPGTWGSLVAAIIAPFVFMPLAREYRAGLLIIIFILGALAANRTEKILDKKDPGRVVIDELAGQWTTYLVFTTLSWLHIAVGFALFRVFDILKPHPVKYFEQRLPGGIGIMADDILAGVYAAAGLLLFMLIRHAAA